MSITGQLLTGRIQVNTVIHTACHTSFVLSLRNCIREPLTQDLLFVIVNSAGGSYRLQVTEVLWSCVCKCWADQVYLSPLAHRFWKLTLQLLSRYATFLTEVNLSRTEKLNFDSIDTQLYPFRLPGPNKDLCSRD